MKSASKKSILLITQYFDPENFRGNDIAYYLAEKGYAVTVITGTPNYPEGKFYPGYGWFKRRKETKNGVKIIRVPIVPRGNNKIQLVLNYFSYWIVASIFLLFHLIRHHYDACIVQQLSPVMMSMPGVFFHKITRKPMYLWVLDLWPESLRGAGGIDNKYVLSIFDIFVKAQYRNAEKILVSSRDFLHPICKYGDYASKVVYFPQWSDVGNQSSNSSEVPTMPEGFKAVFTGNVGEAQDFDHIIEAAKLLDKDENIKLVVVGEGRKTAMVKECVKSDNLEDRIVLMGRYPSDTMNYFMQNADVLFASLKDQKIFNLTVPAKIQTYMSAGKPLVVMMNGAGGKLIKEAECGIAVPAESPREFVEALRTLKNMSAEERNQMGDNARRFYKDNFTKDKCLNNLVEILDLE